MVTVIAFELEQPVVVLTTVKVALYVPAATPPGNVNTIGLPLSAPLITSTKPAALAAALYVILYSSGEPLVELYDKFAVVVP